MYYIKILKVIHAYSRALPDTYLSEHVSNNQVLGVSHSISTCPQFLKSINLEMGVLMGQTPIITANDLFWITIVDN